MGLPGTFDVLQVLVSSVEPPQRPGAPWVALVRDQWGAQRTINAETRVGSGPLPRAGEVWVIQRVENGWIFLSALKTVRPEVTGEVAEGSALRSLIDSMSTLGMVEDATTPEPVFVANLGTTDLNAVIETGSYFQNNSGNATSGRHYPVTAAGWLEVFHANQEGNIYYQRYTMFNSGTGNRIFVRSLFGASWGAWREVAFTDSSDRWTRRSTGFFAAASSITSSAVRPLEGNFTNPFPDVPIIVRLRSSVLATTSASGVRPSVIGVLRDSAGNELTRHEMNTLATAGSQYGLLSDVDYIYPAGTAFFGAQITLINRTSSGSFSISAASNNYYSLTVEPYGGDLVAV